MPQFFIAFLLTLPALIVAETKAPTILCLGDSITEGGRTFQVYRYPLYKKLKTAGLQVKFIGPKTTTTNGVVLRHAGFSGKNAEYIDRNFTKIYQGSPADIILLHAVHNHFAKELPVKNILKALTSIIHKARLINPKVTIIIAQGITSGKLPKYSYIPQLNKEISLLVKKSDTPNQAVLTVNQAEGFHWQTDAIKDKVHPNNSGAEKMAQKWFDTLTSLPIIQRAQSDLIESLPETKELALKLADKTITYKTVSGKELKLHAYFPKDLNPKEKRPAILFIHGGAWTSGSPAVHALESLYFSQRGLITFSMSYRLLKPGGSSPADCLADAKTAMRYLREHSSELNIDPQKIIVCGGSAGGHLAAALSTIKGYNSSSDNLNTSCTPNAMILLYPAFDLVDGWVSGGKICSKHKIDPRAFSPALHVSISTPPTLILSGSEDPIAKSQCNLAFIKYMKSLKRVSSFIEYKGKSHKLFTRHKSDPHFKATLYFMERFLKEQGYLQNILATKPKIKITSHQ